MTDHSEGGNDALLCAPEAKARLETENGVKQVDYIDYLIATHGVTEVRESHILMFHQLAVEDIYPCGGRYRDARFVVRIERAAYALWRLNWIHPFAGGNGRTARALSYLVLCIDMGGTLPGIPQMPTLIFDRRVKYIEALRAADAGVRQMSPPNLGLDTHFSRYARACAAAGCSGYFSSSSA